MFGRESDPLSDHIAGVQEKSASAKPFQLKIGLTPSCRTRTATDLAQSEPLHWMCQQSLRCGEELHRVRQCRVEFEPGLIHPLRVNREHERLPQRLKHIDAQQFSESSQSPADYSWPVWAPFATDGKRRRWPSGQGSVAGDRGNNPFDHSVHRLSRAGPVPNQHNVVVRIDPDNVSPIPYRGEARGWPARPLLLLGVQPP
jgi:hypothetical protein